MPETPPSRRQKPTRRAANRDRLIDDDGLLVYTGPVRPAEDHGDFITRDWPPSQLIDPSKP